MGDFILSHEERKKIFKVLTEEKELNFNSIKDYTGLQSNKLSYQLEKMKEKNFVKKTESGDYTLTVRAQRLIPYFSQIFKQEVGVLPVVLGIVRNNDKILLIKRNKMPYKGYWGLFGGKQINGETIPQAIEREVLEESNLQVEFKDVNGVVCERVKEDDRFKHTFLLIITTVEADSFDVESQDEGEVKWFDFEKVLNGEVENVIPSDLLFLERYHDNSTSVDHVVMDESGDELVLKKQNL